MWTKAASNIWNSFACSYLYVQNYYCAYVQDIIILFIILISFKNSLSCQCDYYYYLFNKKILSLIMFNQVFI